MSPETTARLEAVYARVPRIPCRRKCGAYCGPIFMTTAEWERVKGALPVAPVAEGLDCPMLDRERGTCRVYAVRPLICRLWGVVRKMTCPHGCRPERWLTDAEAQALVTEVNAISDGELACPHGVMEGLTEVFGGQDGPFRLLGAGP